MKKKSFLCSLMFLFTLSILNAPFPFFDLSGQDLMASSTVTYYDMWDYMCHDNWQNKHMDGSHKMINKVKDNNTSLLFTKTSLGYPFELFMLIGNEIYMKYEGLKWPGDSGTTFEKASTYRYYKGGEFLWCPRYVYSRQKWSTGWFHECYVTNCAHDRSQSGSMNASAFYQSAVAFGGDVGTKPCVIITDTYGSGEDQKWESYYYVKEYGLVRWNMSYWDYNQGKLVIERQSDFNYQKNGTYSEYAPCWPAQDCNW